MTLTPSSRSLYETARKVVILYKELQRLSTTGKMRLLRDSFRCPYFTDLFAFSFQYPLSTFACFLAAE
jgi:hypothetical protein